MERTKRRVLLSALTVTITLAVPQYAAVYTVAKNGDGDFTSIQAAVDKAGPDDEIIIGDAAVYDEQVTIDSTKNGLILRSRELHSATKPVIRYKDVKNVNPRNYEESLRAATINYNTNGALRIIGAKRITIAGLIVDGDGRVPFSYPAVWGGINYLFHGNAAITLCLSGDVIVQYCEVRNAYYGIYCYDRNSGGAFAYVDKEGLLPEEIVPFAGFAKVGNHLIEHNRICNNTWGIYFESLWDMGSTVRYNILFDNHHENETAAKQIAAAPGGNEQAGGAILFKNTLFTPVAIHNNTFYHNYLLFAGISPAGTQHLIFNNIYSVPYRLWSDDPVFKNPLQALDMFFVNRMFNCVYSCQAEAPETTTVEIVDSVYDNAAGAYVRYDTLFTALSRIRIMSGMEQVKPGMTVEISVHMSKKDTVVTKTVADVIQPGNLITASNTIKPFPESSNIRWMDIPFLSTDPSHPQFLEPDWANERVVEYVKDKGWEVSGIKDPDQSPADLGAIPYAQCWTKDVVTMRPIVPVLFDRGTATINIFVFPRIGEITSPVLKLSRVVMNLDSSSGNSGYGFVAVKDDNVRSLSVSATSLKVGLNTIRVTLPAPPGNFAFFEFIVEGLDSDGMPFASTLGLIPYRKLDYYFMVTVQDSAKTKTLTEIRAGEPVNIHIEAFKDIGTIMTSSISPIVLNLGSTFDLSTPAGSKLDTLEGVMPEGTSDIPAVFTRIPEGGIDQVLVAGTYGDIAFLGASGDIKILGGGPPEIITFQEPASHMTSIAYANATTPVTVKVFDEFGNVITDPVKVTCVSLLPTIGDIAIKEIETDMAGRATFLAIVKEGVKGDTFPVVVSLPQSGKSDTAYLVCGGPMAVMHPMAKAGNQRLYTCELVDLHGRLVKRFAAGEDFLSGGREQPFLNNLGRGMYLQRLIEVKTGRVINGRRMILRK